VPNRVESLGENPPLNLPFQGVGANHAQSPPLKMVGEVEQYEALTVIVSDVATCVKTHLT
jgi:hypothetical protein